MKNSKKIISLFLVILFALNNFVIAYAEDNVEFVSDSSGSESQKIYYQAEYNNFSGETAHPALFIAKYNNNVLSEFDKKVFPSGLPDEGNDVLKGTVSDTVSDGTRIVGFSLNNLNDAKPISYKEIKKFGSNKKKIESVSVNGVGGSDIVIDEPNKSITFYLPLFDKDGDDFPINALNTIVTLDDAKASVCMYGSSDVFSGATMQKEGVVDYSKSPKFVVTAEDGSKAIYHTKIYRKLYTGFEDGLITGATMKNGQIVPNDGDKAIGKKAGEYIYLLKGSVASGFDVTQNDENIFARLENVTDYDGKESNALYMEKSKQVQTGNTNSIRLCFGNIKGLSVMPKEMEINCDIKYVEVEGDMNNNPGVSGIETYGSKLYHRVTTDGKTPFTSATISVNSQKAAGATCTNWNRVKVLWTVDKNDGVHSKTYINGTHLSAADDTNQGTAMTVNDKPLFYVSLSAQRCAGMYVDNVSFQYLISDNTSDVEKQETESTVFTKKNTLSFEPSISEEGVINVSGIANEGYVFVAVYKTADKNNVLSLDEVSDDDFVVLDTRLTDSNGNFLYNWELPDKSKTGFYTFVIGNTDLETPQTIRRSTIYYASTNEIEQAIYDINHATSANLISVIESTADILQTNVCLEDDNYEKYKQTQDKGIADVFLADREGTFQTAEEIRSALKKTIGTCALLNCSAAELNDTITKYNDVLDIDKSEYGDNEQALKECFEGVLKEYLSEKTASSNNAKEMFERAVCMARINKASAGEIFALIDQNSQILGFTISGISDAEKLIIAKKIYIGNDKGYTSVSALKTAINNAAEELSKDSHTTSAFKSENGKTPNIGIAGSIITDNNNRLFVDLDNAEWARIYIESLAEKGIVSGKGDKIFEPKENVKREEFVKMLVLAAEISQSKDNHFSDVDEEQWYAPFIGGATENGLVSGYDDGSFGIGTYISRQDAVAIVYRAISSYIEETQDDFDINFTDYDNISEYAKEAVKVCAQYKIISGNENNEFLPFNNMTRAECAKIIYCTMSFLEQNKKNMSVDLASTTKELNELKALGFFTQDIPDYDAVVTNAEMVGIMYDLTGFSEPEFDSKKTRFSDVVEETKNSNKIQGLYDLGYIDQDGKFYPDADTASDYTVACLLNVMGYKDYVQLIGGYWKVAVDINLISGTKLSNKSTVTWRQLIRLIYNALDAPLCKLSKNSWLDKKYSVIEGITLLSENFDVHPFEGIVSANGFAALTGFGTVSDDSIRIEDDVMNAGTTDISMALGYKVKGYAKYDDSEYTVLYYEQCGNDVTFIDSVDLETESTEWSMNNIVYNLNGKSKSISIPREADIIYNGKAYYGNDANDFKIVSGNIVAIDNNSDGKVDVLIVNGYENYIVSAYDSNQEILYDKTGKKISFYDVKPKVIIYDANGERIDISQLSENAVFTAMVSKDKTLILGYVTRNKIDGAVTFMSNGNDGRNIVRLGTTDYTISKDWENSAFEGKTEFVIGGMYVCYLDFFNRIAYVVDKGTEGIQYGYYNGIRFDDFDFTVQMKVLTQRGTWEYLNCSDNLKIDNRRVNLNNRADFSQFYDDEVKPQLIKFKLDKDGNMNAVYTAKEGGEGISSDNLIKNKPVSKLRYRTDSSSFGLDYFFDGKTKVFNLVTDDDGKIDEKLTNIISASDFINDKSYTFDVYDADEFGTISVAVVNDISQNDYWNAGAIFVEKVYTAVNDDEELVHVISGLNNGNEVEYMAVNDEDIASVKRGDIIVAHFNKRGLIDRPVEHIFESGETFEMGDKGLRGATSYTGEIYVMKGYPTAKNSSCLVLDYGKIAKIPLSNAKTIVVYDTQAHRNKMFEVASVNEIICGDSLETASKILVYYRVCTPMAIVIVR